MLSCSKNRKSLDAYMDGELSGRRQAAVERHLARCDSCRAALNDLRDLKPFLSSLDVAPAPNYLTKRILTEAHEQKRGKRPGLLWSCLEALWYPSWVVKDATAAALIAGLTMGTYMGWSSFPTSGLESRMTASIAVSDDSNFYTFDAMSAAPDGSLEAAILKQLEKNR